METSFTEFTIFEETKKKKKKKRRSDFDILSIIKEIFKYTFQCVLTRINLINSLRNRNINTLTSILKLKNRNSNSCLFSFLASSRYKSRQEFIQKSN